MERERCGTVNDLFYILCYLLSECQYRPLAHRQNGRSGEQLKGSNIQQTE